MAPAHAPAVRADSERWTPNGCICDGPVSAGLNDGPVTVLIDAQSPTQLAPFEPRSDAATGAVVACAKPVALMAWFGPRTESIERSADLYDLGAEHLVAVADPPGALIAVLTADLTRGRTTLRDTTR